MLKIRLQGKISDINWFKKVLAHISHIELIDFSEPYLNTDKKTYRVYGSIQKKKKKKEKKENKGE